MTINIATASFDELEDEFGYVLRRFADWEIAGMDRDDVMQELRLILWKCQKKFDSSAMPNKNIGQPHPASFRTYLYRSIKNQLGKLTHKVMWTQKSGARVVVKDGVIQRHSNGTLVVVAPETPVSIDLGQVDCADEVSEIQEVEYLAGLTGLARDIAQIALSGNVKRSDDWAAFGVSEADLKKVAKEIRGVLGYIDTR